MADTTKSKDDPQAKTETVEVENQPTVSPPNASTRPKHEVPNTPESFDPTKTSVEDPAHPGNDSDVIRRDVGGGNRVTGIPNNLLEEASADEATAELVLALRRMPVGTFQFLGDLRTPEASIRAALAIREVLQSQGLDVRKMTDKEKKDREDARLAPAPTADPVTVDTNPQPAATKNTDKA